MDAARWVTVEALFWRLLELPEADREPTLTEIRTSDPEIAREVESLLAEAAADPGFLDTPLADPTSAVDDLGDPSADRRIGPWRLIRPLGRGGMGEVHLAVQADEDVDRYVALKVIRSDVDVDRLVDRFQTERRILASLDHPSIARLFHVGSTDDGRPYFAMEFVTGTPISEYVRTAGLDLDARIALFQEVCAAVQHAHQRLVVHRDLKPENVLVTEDGRPKLLDFGISAALDDAGAAASRSGALTPRFAAPELRRGDPAGVPADVYALGVLLHLLVTDRHPTELHDAVLDGDPPPDREAAVRLLRTSAPDLSEDLAWIVARAMSAVPERRYWTPATLAEDLERARRTRPVEARPATSGYVLRRFLRRNLVGSLAAAAVVVLLLGFSVVTALQSARIAEESARVARERDEALAVRTFLLESFSSTGPDQAAGDTVTARQLLDRRAAILDSEYADRPLLRAEMMGVLADGYERLGLFADAEPMANGALDLLRTHAPDDAELAPALNTLGWIQHQAGRLDEAATTLEAAVERARAAYPEGHPVVARALNDLGVNLEARGDLEGAEARYAESLEMRRALLGREDAAVAVTASNLSVVRYRQGNLAGAAAMAREALELFRTALGPDNARTMIVENNLAAMEAAAGEWEAARSTYRDILERQRRIFGPRHPQTARSMAALAAVLGEESSEEAARLFRDAREIQIETLGPKHPQVGVTTGRLAQALAMRPETRAESRPFFEEALRIQRATLGPRHRSVGETLALLAPIVADDDLGGAIRTMREAVSIQTETLGADHPVTARSSVGLARLLLQSGRDDGEAERRIDEGLRVLTAAYDEDHVRVQEARAERVHLLWLRGETQRADTLLAGIEARLPGMEVARTTLHDRVRALRRAIDEAG